ncbi:bacterio-opsin activator HTH domain-containing protein [Halorubrum aidingense JCM 13560]|uniref:Bacterio-opsin activator HTH domain-containing protein n=1 Tax=Halorubrum aidingense JCM 13560 TaxID=1230454 RepID=M0PIG2_9EURY|nr:helix-turn-helix domain-containing protein [Halorubrum aidingense]EMA69713.1 bacterio-opsin activator HTH domain-containing protein [Halorubrum aidingense JCM 13560]
MTVFANVELSPTDPALGSLADTGTDSAYRVPLVLRSDSSIVLYALFGDGYSASAVETLRDSESVTSAQVVDHVGNSRLVSITLPLRSARGIGTLAKSDVEIVEAVGTSETWLFRVRAPDRDSLRELAERCEREPDTVRVGRVYEQISGPERVESVLTPQQETALRTAGDAGYFRVPRETSLGELSEELAVSDSAVSQRLRRGTDALLSAVFGTRDRDR